MGLQRVEFWVDGRLVDTRSSAPYSLAWPPQPGSHTLKIVAYDLAGNTGQPRCNSRLISRVVRESCFYGLIWALRAQIKP